MDLKFKLNICFLVIVFASVCVINGDIVCKKIPEFYGEPVSRRQESKDILESGTICNVLNVNFKTKIYFTQHFAIEEKFRDISTLNFIKSSITYIPRSIFSDIWLKVLRMKGCGLVEISPYTFERAYSLHTVDLSHNAITELNYIAFRGTNYLKNINLAHNKIERIDPSAFANLKELKFLDLSNNYIVNFPPLIFHPNEIVQLFELNLNANRITYIDDISFKSYSVKQLSLDNNNITEILINFENIESISLNNNAIIALTVAAETKVESLAADNNRIRNENLKIDNQSNIKKLSLANNSLNNVDFIKSMDQLHFIDLSFNPIASDRIENDTFLLLTDLKFLSLAGINLKHLDLQLFSQLTNMRTLDVAYNNLETISLEEFKNINKLYINGNSLKLLDNKQFKNLISQLSMIDVTNDDLECNTIEKLFKQNGINERILVRGIEWCDDWNSDSGAINDSKYMETALNEIEIELDKIETANVRLKYELVSMVKYLEKEPLNV